MRGQSILAVLLLLLSVSSVVSGRGESIEQRYTWQSAGRTWNLTHRFSAEHYRFFRTLPRIVDYTKYADYVNDNVESPDLDKTWQWPQKK